MDRSYGRGKIGNAKGRPLRMKEDDSVAAKLAARYAAAASLAQRQNDMEAMFASSPLSQRFAEWAAGNTPETPESRSQRVKPLGRENGGLCQRPTTPSEAAKEVFATRLRERSPLNRLQLRVTSSRTARSEVAPRRLQRSVSPPKAFRPKSFRLTSQRSSGGAVPVVPVSEPLPQWPSEDVETSTFSPQLDGTGSTVALSSPESNSAAVAAAISAAATAVWHAAEAEAEAAAKAGRSLEPSPKEPSPTTSESPGLAPGLSGTATPIASVSHVSRSTSASRVMERPASVNIPTIPTVPVLIPAVPRSFYGPLVPMTCPGVVTVPMSRSPSPGQPMCHVETGTPRSRYVNSPSVIVRRSTSPITTPAGSMTVGVPAEKSMAALAWAAAGRTPAMSRSSSAMPVARGYGIPMGTTGRIEATNSRSQRGLDMSDSMDVALYDALRRLDTLTTARLEVHKLAPGRYRIEGRQVQLRAKGASPRLGQHKELLVHEEEASGLLKEGLDLSFYLSQAANVAAALRVSAVGRIPQELRLTFGDNDQKGPGVEDVSPSSRQRCMRQAVAEAAQRSQAAEVLEKQLIGRTTVMGEDQFAKAGKATMLSL